MEIKKIFNLISQKMMAEFYISAEFNHHGVKGDYREDALKNFLENGKLPKQYKLGNGEIISSYSQTSKQTDLIVYDNNKSIIFQASDSIQIYPIETIYGIIEIKSKLSKQKLNEGLENIKSLKQIHSPSFISKKLGPTSTVTYGNTPPFGVIFAYDLGGNSLDSLEENLREWCSKNPASVWPNMICVLNQGLILFREGLKDRLHSNEITDECTTIGLHFKEDSLFEFTSRLISLCSTRKVEVFDISQYSDIGLIVDGLRVKGVRRWKHKDDPSKQFCLKQEFIKKVYSECKEQISSKQLLIKRLGNISGLEQLYQDTNGLVYLYNPENYKGMADILSTPTQSSESIIERLQNEKNIANGFFMYINEVPYFVPYIYVTDEDLE
ncbi:DUF6602 domain-containing protein [Acinetobacter baumannii]|uniref:DUF6602 domain-containing protein n=1 Tax=Acinetobacter TaxID=469 RepID=UPI0034CFC4D9|nr:hypothetical protein [Acinetobacter baumannii]HAV5361593.1 hypothetical protein [Acinetobacter baumannii]